MWSLFASTTPTHIDVGALLSFRPGGGLYDLRESYLADNTRYSDTATAPTPDEYLNRSAELLASQGWSVSIIEEGSNQHVIVRSILSTPEPMPPTSEPSTSEPTTSERPASDPSTLTPPSSESRTPDRPDSYGSAPMVYYQSVYPDEYAKIKEHERENLVEICLTPSPKEIANSEGQDTEVSQSRQ